jgi:hypothetical protein
MTENRGVARLRAIVRNQSDLGEREVVIPLEDAMDLLDELEEEAAEWRARYSNLCASLGMTDDNPEHYRGDGVVSCSRAMRSMLAGWEMTRDGGGVPLACAYWAATAFKYLWRFPLKGAPKEDLMKALDCAGRALDEWED